MQDLNCQGDGTMYSGGGRALNPARPDRVQYRKEWIMAHLHTASTPFRTAVVALAGTALLAGPPHFTGGMLEWQGAGEKVVTD